MMILEDYLKYAVTLLVLPWDVFILTYFGYKWVKRLNKTHFFGIKVSPDHIDGSSTKVQSYMKWQKTSEEKAIKDVKRMYIVDRVCIFFVVLKLITSPFLTLAPIFGYWGKITDTEYSTELDEVFFLASVNGFSFFPFVWFPIVYGVNQYRMLDEDFPRINQRQKFLNDCKRSDYTDDHFCGLYYRTFEDENPRFYVEKMHEVIYDKAGKLSFESRCEYVLDLALFYANRDMPSRIEILNYGCTSLDCIGACERLETYNED